MESFRSLRSRACAIGWRKELDCFHSVAIEEWKSPHWLWSQPLWTISIQPHAFLHTVLMSQVNDWFDCHIYELSCHWSCPAWRTRRARQELARPLYATRLNNSRWPTRICASSFKYDLEAGTSRCFEWYHWCSVRLCQNVNEWEDILLIVGEMYLRLFSEEVSDID